jgi:hypothetical protein
LGHEFRRHDFDYADRTTLIKSLVLKTLFVLLILPASIRGQDDDNWPSLSYLRHDYRAVQIVAHIRIQGAEITNRVGGYEDWKIKAEVIESFKGKFKKGDVFTYSHGAEAGFKKEYFSGEKIVFLLAESGHYVVLENSTLPSNPDRIKKLRLIKGSSSRKRSKR